MPRGKRNPGRKQRRPTWDEGDRLQTVQPKNARYHGLAPEQVQHMIDAQQGCCIPCGRPLDQHWVIDHDHELAKRHGHDVRHGCPRCVRGILCRSCNHALGDVKDDPGRLRGLFEYLKAAQAKQARR